MRQYFKSVITLGLSALLLGCGGSKLPPPTPLTDFPAEAKIKKNWSTNATTGNDGLLFPLTPTYSDNTLYTAGYSGDIAAIDMTTGKKIWQRQDENVHFSSNLALNSDFLYLGTDDAQVLKFNRKDGSLIWEKSTPSTVIAAPNATERFVFAKTINGELTALDTSTGEVAWNYAQTPPSLILRDTSDPVINAHTLLVGFANGMLLALDPNSGNVLWTKQINLPEGKTDVERMADVAATPKIVDNIIYAATYQGKLVAFGANSPEENLWSLDISTYNNFSLSSQALFLSDNDGNVIAVDIKTGGILWKQNALLYRYVTAPIYLDNDLVAVGDKEGYVHLLSAKDGHFVARILVDSAGIIAPPLYVNHQLIIQSNDGHVYAFTIIA